MGNTKIECICSHSQSIIDEKAGQILDEEEMQTEFHQIEDECSQMNLEKPLDDEFINYQFKRNFLAKKGVFKLSEMSTKMTTSSIEGEPLKNQKEEDNFLENQLAASTISDLFQSFFREEHPSISRSIIDYVTLRRDRIENHYSMKRLLSQSKTSSVLEAIKIEGKLRRALKEIRVPKKQPFICEETSRLNFEELKLRSRSGLIPILDHSNIVRIYEIYELEKKVILVMEFFESTLSKFISEWKVGAKKNNKNNSSYQEYIKIMMNQILRALSYLHDKKIGHLHINDKNIMLVKAYPRDSTEVIAKLVGFGSSKIDMSDGLEPLMEKKSKELGILQAPEIQTQNQAGLKTDLWNLGIVLFKAMIRQDSNLELNKRIKSYNEIPEYLSSVWRAHRQEYELDENCFDLIMKMVRVDYGKRISARECLNEAWFATDLSDPEEAIGGCNKVVEMLIKASKYNNFINLVKNILIYKNVNQRQIHKFSQIFHEVDKDHSGVIQMDELLDHLERANLSENKQFLKQTCLDIIEKADNDDSGALDFHQFLHNICNLSKFITEKNLEDVFDHLDWNGDGSISIQELQRVFQSCNFTEIQDYMKNIDKDYDGKINRTQFINYCTKIMANGQK